MKAGSSEAAGDIGQQTWWCRRTQPESGGHWRGLGMVVSRKGRLSEKNDPPPPNKK